MSSTSCMKEWSENKVTAENDSIHVTKKEDSFTLDDLFVGYDESYISEEIDWGNPVGCEVW